MNSTQIANTIANIVKTVGDCGIVEANLAHLGVWDRNTLDHRVGVVRGEQSALAIGLNLVTESTIEVDY